MAEKSDKTEKATPKKRRDERKKGNVFLSKDAVSIATLAGGVLILRVLFPGAVDAIQDFFAYCFELTTGGSEGLSGALLTQCVILVARTVGPLLLVTVLAAVVSTFAQTRLLVSGQLLKPKFNRISPLQGFKRLFSLRSIVEALKGIIKITILLALIYTCLQDMMETAELYLYADLRSASIHMFQAIFSMLLKVMVAFLVLAAVDFMYQWWDYERQMKMSKQEIKEEYKQTEGDPQIKGKIKQLQRQMAQSRMMQQVPQSDVVIRNPTHFAVALRYHPGEDDAPMVLAKGQDELALRIAAVAQEHGVPVIENVPLARALYAKTELNAPIPPDLYDTVAEVMVYLYKLGRIKPAPKR